MVVHLIAIALYLATVALAALGAARRRARWRTRRSWVVAGWRLLRRHPRLRRSCVRLARRRLRRRHPLVAGGLGMVARLARPAS